MRLIIAEKNIAARRIADILSGSEKPGKGTPVRTGKENGVNTYRFEDTVTLGLRGGHVVEIDFEPGYSNWRSEVNTPPEPLSMREPLKNRPRKISFP